MGKYSDLFSSAPSSVSKVTPEAIQLAGAKRSAQVRIGSSPAIATSGKYAELFKKTEDIAAGKPSKSRGLWGVIGGSALKGLENVGYILGTPARTTASVAKEITDVIEGRGFSPKDLVSQVADKNFYGSTLIKKTGNPWLDSVTGFAVDVLSDPTTYVTFGASAWMGKSGRLALAAKAAEAANIAKAPSLAGKLDEIARLGVHANLTDAERVLLNAPKGVSWTFGGKAGQVIGKEGTTARKVSEGLSTAVGKPISQARARVGDLPFLEPVQKAITPKSIRDAELLPLGRSNVKLNTNEIVEKLAGYSAAQRGKALSRSFVAKIGASNQQLAKEINQFEGSTGLRVAHFIEDDTLVPPTPQAQAIVSKVKQFLADTRQAGNDVTAEFAGRRGVRTYDINHRDNYVPHTLSEATKKYLSSKRWRGTRYASAIQQTLELSPDEFIKGPAVMRARKLEAGKEWLGETLQTGTIKEINDISERKLGFKWFEDDGATYLNSYIDSVGNQAKRVAFTDRLFDYGADVVRAIDYKLIPDKEVVRAWHSSVRSWERMLGTVLKEQGRGASQASSVMQKANNVARQIVQDRNTKLIFSQQEVARLTEQVSQAQYFLDVASERAAARGGALQQQFEATVAPFRARLQATQEALSTNNQIELAATMYLEEAHARMFPRMKKRPTDPQVMAEQILAKSESRTASRVKALETRRDRLKRSIGERGGKTKAARLAGGELDSARAELDAINAEIAFHNELLQTASEEFPDGVYFVGRPELDLAAPDPRPGVAPRNAGVKVSRSIPEDYTPEWYTIGYAPKIGPDPDSRILRPLYSQEEYTAFWDGIAKGISDGVAKLGDQRTSELLDAAWDLISRGRARAVDPRLAEAEPELIEVFNNIKRLMDKSVDNVDEALLNGEFELMSFQLEDWLGRQITANGAPPDVFEDGMDMIYDAIGQIGNPHHGFSNIIGVDIAGLNFGDDATDYILNGGWVSRTFNNIPDNAAVMFESGTYEPLTAMMAAQEGRDLASSMVATSKEAFESATKAVKETREQAAKVGREIGGVRGAASRLEGRVRGASETIRRSVEEVEIPDGKGGTRLVSRDEAAKQAGLDARKIARAEKKLAKEIANDPLVKEARQAGRTVNRVEASMNNAKALRGEAAEWEQAYGASYREDVVELDRLLAERPPKGASAEVNAEWFNQVENVYNQIRNPQIFTEPQRNALERIFVQKRGQEAQIAMLEQYVDFGKGMLDRAKSGELGGRMVQDIKEGWGAIEGLGVQMPDELRSLMFGKIERLADPKEFNKFLDAYFRYQRFFKVTAMLTPGFIVRNAMTAAFNNYVAGVTTRETADAIRFSQNALKHGPAKAIEMVPAAERKLYETAYDVVMATGAGQTADDFFYPIASSKGQRWLNSRIVTAWRNRNEQVEMAGRMALAVSSLKKDLGFDGAASQVARYHFDYTDLSKLDEAAKRVIPFWTFASRNIPLQIVNQIARPGLYRAYDSLERNFDVDENMVLAPWMQANRPISGPGGRIIMPDLPFIDMENQLRMFGDPMRLASQLNPAVKLPIELMGNRQLGLDIPFSQKPYEVRGPLDLPSALAGGLFGQTTTTPEGQMITSSKAGYAIPSLLPTLAQLQRLVPQLGGKETYVARQPYSILSAGLGIPLRGVSEQEQANELIRRQFALRDFLSNLTRTGYLEPKG